jgi:hypothetical protein
MRMMTAANRCCNTANTTVRRAKKINQVTVGFVFCVAGDGLEVEAAVEVDDGDDALKSGDDALDGGDVLRSRVRGTSVEGTAAVGGDEGCCCCCCCGCG